MKKNKKVLLIGAVVLLGLGLIVWYFSKKDPVTGNVTSGTETTAADVLISETMNYIKSDATWNAEIQRKAVINGTTYNQQLAADAIDALKSQTKLPATYQFVKAKY